MPVSQPNSKPAEAAKATSSTRVRSGAKPPKEAQTPIRKQTLPHQSIESYICLCEIIETCGML
jgi:hypothetical protein